MAGTQYCISIGEWNTYTEPFTICEEGITTISYRSIDNAGNIEEVKQQHVKIDRIPPATDIKLEGTTRNEGWFISNVEVELTAKDKEGGSGVWETYYRLDGGTWSEYSGPFAIETEGMNDLLFHSIDVAGNVEEERLLTIKIDKAPPTIAISVPSVTKESVTPSIEVSDNVDLEPEMKLTLDGSPYDGSSPVTQEGVHTIVVEAVDDAGNVATQSATFAIDKTHPEARITFDIGEMGIVVLGIDNIDDDVLVEVLSDRLLGRWSKGGVGYEKRAIEYELEDDAGNIMAMKLELLLGWADSYCWSEARVLEISYDGFEPMAPDWNSYNVAFETSSGAGESRRVLGQIVYVERDTLVLTKYDRGKDVTTIALIKDLRTVEKVIAHGLVIVEFATDEGGLGCEY